MVDPEFTLLGDALWLDFVNSARGRAASPPDLLPDQAAYHRWTKAERLISDADRVPFAEVIEFRRHLTALAEALDAGRQPPGAAITAVNDALARTAGAHRLVRVGGAWRLQFAPDGAPAALEAIALSAASSLADPSAAVRRCAGATCSLFIADRSPNQSRRWCSPSICGAGARVERRRGLRR